MNLNWKILQRAGEMKSIDVFYNFMIMDANRNVLWKDPARVPPAGIEKMNAAWGDDSWRTAAYSRERGLFHDIETKRSNEQIARAFQTRLREVAGFSYVPDPIPMKNSTGAVIYYLFFASQKAVAKKIVSDIFDKYRNR